MRNSVLINLYNKISKHSHYQVLATCLRETVLGGVQDLRPSWEDARLHFIMKHLPYKDASIADVGGNTGYFTLELIYSGARRVVFFEGNRTHSDFVREAISFLNIQDKVTIYPQYLIFEDDISLIDVDITLLLNVLHHVGDDYGVKSQTLAEAKMNILRSLSRLSERTSYLVFQLGFNWKGDVNYPLFEGGTKSEMINFIEQGVRDSWAVERVGIAEKINDLVRYNQVNANNLARDDSLGEFLNRPIFIMKSKRYAKKN